MVTQATEGGLLVRGRFPEAEEVCVVVNLNSWSSVETAMVDVGDGLWEATLPLEAEEHGFWFFVRHHGERAARLLRDDGVPLAAALV